MANTFFGFNTTLNEHGDRLGSSPEDIEGLSAEEEYDALNDETFGALEGDPDLDDWEAQHEQLAEIAESSRHTNHIESFLDGLVLTDDETITPKDSNVWAYNEVKNGDKFTQSEPKFGMPVPRLRTVEELERSLIQSAPPIPRYPPGLLPWHPQPPPGLVRMPPPGFPHPLPQNPHRAMHPYPLPPHHVQQIPPMIPLAQHFPFPAPRLGPRPRGFPVPQIQQQRPLHLMQHLQQIQPQDEYAGLMNHREKQWLLNIQLLQVNTGTPYFDDYYYTVFKERQSKQHHRSPIRYPHPPSTSTVKKPPYTPLQFENSLGKLQLGSVTAPRKIIDTDVISGGAGNASGGSSNKAVLLELEHMWGLLLRAEDMRNPLALANRDKLLELRQKQRLREIEQAGTPEAKQEVLRLLQAEATVLDSTSSFSLLSRLLTLLTPSDRLSVYLCVRKGKSLLLRALPALHAELGLRTRLAQQLYPRILQSLAQPVVARRDLLAGDNLLPGLLKHIQHGIQHQDQDSVNEMVHRCQNMQMIVQNKLSMSVVAILVARICAIASSGGDPTWAGAEWLTTLADALHAAGPTAAAPLQPLPPSALALPPTLTPQHHQLLQHIFTNT